MDRLRYRLHWIAAAFATAAVPLVLVAEIAEAAATQAGVAAAVRGKVELRPVRTEPVGRAVETGTPIYLGDQVVTGDGGRLQILLLDETVFTIGPNSALTIDEFVYNPEKNAGQVAASISKGVFRFVSGKVAKKNPENMKVELPAGTIGIRGTSVAGATDGTSATVVLLGPGPRNNIGARPGAIVVGNRGGTVSLTAPRFGTTLRDAFTPPEPPRLWSPERLNALTSALVGGRDAPQRGAGRRGAQPGAGSDDVEEEKDPSQASDEDQKVKEEGSQSQSTGESEAGPRAEQADPEDNSQPPAAPARDDGELADDRPQPFEPRRPDDDSPELRWSEGAEDTPEAGDALPSPSDLANQGLTDPIEFLDDFPIDPNTDPADILDDAGQDQAQDQPWLGPPPDGPASWEWFALAPSPPLSALYFEPTTPLLPGPGFEPSSYGLKLLVDFATRSLDFGVSSRGYWLGGSQYFLAPSNGLSLDLRSLAGPAQIQHQFVSPEGNDFALDMTFVNSGGELGEHLDHNLTISNSGGDLISGGTSTGRILFDPALDPPPTFDLPDGPSLWWDFPFTAPVSLAAVYTDYGVPLSNGASDPAGSYNFELYVDYGARDARVQVWSPEYRIESLPYYLGLGTVVGGNFAGASGRAEMTRSFSHQGHDFDVSFQLNNQGGTAGAVASHSLSISKPGGETIAGSDQTGLSSFVDLDVDGLPFSTPDPGGPIASDGPLPGATLWDHIPVTYPPSVGGFYQQVGVNLDPSPPGLSSFYDFEMLVDFGSRSADVFLVVPSYWIGSQNYFLPPGYIYSVDYSSLTGLATSSVQFQHLGRHDFQLEVDLRNGPGVVGQLADHTLTISDAGLGQVISGSGTAMLSYVDLSAWPPPPTGPPDGFSVWQDFPLVWPRTLEGSYYQAGIPMTAISGTGFGSYNFSMWIDFGGRFIEVDVDLPSYNLNGSDFSLSNYHYTHDYAGLAGTADVLTQFQDTVNEIDFDLEVVFRNDAGVPAKFADHQLTASNAFGDSIQGAGTAVLFETVADVSFWDELRDIPSGTAQYVTTAASLSPDFGSTGFGSYDMQMSVDFAARQVTLDQLDISYQFAGSPQFFSHPDAGSVVMDYATQPGTAQIFDIETTPSGDTVKSFAQFTHDAADPAGFLESFVEIEENGGGNRLLGGAEVPRNP